MSTGIALVVAVGAFGWLIWRQLPWLPLEGMSRLAFVLGCWWGGGWLLYGAIFHQLYYWAPALLVGLGLLALAGWMTYIPYRRYRRDQVLFGRTGPAAPWLEPEREKDKAA